MRGRRLLTDVSGASAAEFSLVLPVLVMLIFGIIDTGRWLYTYNKLEKATQMGARFAVVTDPVAPGLDTSYVGVGGLTQGDVIPASQFGMIRCTSASCTCVTTPCPTPGTADSTAFNAIVNRMRLFAKEVTTGNVTIEYSSSGLGYAGNPNGPDLSPLVTVQVSSLTFHPMSFLIFKRNGLTMPIFRASLTAEDFKGSQSN